MSAANERSPRAPGPDDPRGPYGSGVYVGPPMATRREFARAAAATAAAAVAAARRAFAEEGEPAQDSPGADTDEPDEAAEQPEETQAATRPVPTEPTPSAIDSEGNENILNGFDDQIDEIVFRPLATYSLPIGSVVYADCETRAAVIQANETVQPLTVIGCLDYASGEYAVVLEQPVGGMRYAPSEAHCTDLLMAWVEMDNATDAWALYAAPFSGEPISSVTPGITKLAEGDSDWLPPQFDVSGNSVVWQVMPDPNGPYSLQNSIAYLWTLSAGAASVIYESPGRFACEPNVSANILTLTPRVPVASGVRYAIVALDMANGLVVVDRQEMPNSVKPFRATRIGNNFAFSVEANYGYGGRLGNMGYYIGPGGGPFQYVSREPSAHISYAGGLYIVKSQLSYFVIDLANRSFASIGAANKCVSYGDYPATAGTSGRFVTYAATKDSATGIPSSVTVRLFDMVPQAPTLPGELQTKDDQRSA